MITGYFDDSGTDRGNQVAVVGGYLANTHQWNQFIPRWQELLKEYDVKQMHRADLENWQDEFTMERGWTPTRRAEFVRKAQKIIKRYTYIPVGSAVIKKDYEELLPSAIKEFYGGMYGWCAHDCVIAVSRWCDRAQYHEPIDWVFERGTAGSREIELFFQLCSENTSFTRIAPNGWSFKGKDVIPLQAADLVAYEMFKQVQNQIVEQGKRDIRLSAQDLWLKDDRTFMKYWNRDRLTRWLNEPKIQSFIKWINEFMEARKNTK
jgi:hypothetical protein